MSDDLRIPPDVAARLIALEQQVAHLYAALGLVAPSPADAVAVSLGPEARRLAAAGDRAGAVRAVMREEGVSQQTAIARVDAYDSRRSI